MIKRLFGKERPEPPREERPPREGVPLGFNREKPMLTITDIARERVQAVLQSQEPAADAIRVTGDPRGKYQMSLEAEGKPALDDTVLPYEGFRVFVDPQSLPYVDGATLDYVETAAGAGFQFTNPNPPPGRPARKPVPEGPEGEIWRQIQEIFESQINPAIAAHGGHVTLMDVQDGTVYVEMGGGCQGCGMANVTLKHGIEQVLKDELPEIREVLDVTDHAGGRNPYYAPSSK